MVVHHSVSVSLLRSEHCDLQPGILRADPKENYLEVANCLALPEEVWKHVGI